MAVEGQLSPGMMASLVAAAVSLAGLLSMAALGDWARRNSPYFSSFAIGVLIVAVLFHLIPEAISGAESAWISLAAGAFIMTAIGVALRSVGRRDTSRSRFAFGFASIIALGFHSFMDGVVYETTFHEDIFTGWISTAGLLLHEFPEGVIAFYLMKEARLNTFMAALAAMVASSLTTVVGACVSGIMIARFTELPVHHLLAAAAGALTYVIVFHLGPHARLTPGNRGYHFAGIGVVIATLAEVFRHAGHF